MLRSKDGNGFGYDGVFADWEKVLPQTGACHQCELLPMAWLAVRQRNISSGLTHGRCDGLCLILEEVPTFRQHPQP
nr:hypothetical protein [Tanacetum cinerariifolium]